MVRLRDIPIKIARRLLKILYFDQHLYLYQLNQQKGVKQKIAHSVKVLKRIEDLSGYSVEPDIKPYLEDMLHQKYTCYVAVIGLNIVAMAPVSFSDTHVSEVNKIFTVDNESAYIFSCYTSKQFEGNGLYQSLLHYISSDLNNRTIFIMSLKENHPSRRSIEKLAEKLGEIRLTRYLIQFFHYSASTSVKTYFK